MLTADEVAAVSGGRTAQDIAPDVVETAVAEGPGYPQNPAGPVIPEAAGTQFNRK